MTINEFLATIAQVSGLLGIVSSMLGMGLGLTLAQITQPLKNARLVVLVLLANFVLVPLLAFGISLVLPLSEALKIGLIIIACSAGAPFLVLEARGAKANLALAVGVMSLLMVITVFFLPIVLPLLLTGVEVNPWDIAKSLIMLMLIPLILGLVVRSNSPDTAAHWAPFMNKAGSVSIMILLVVGLGLNAANVSNLIGTSGFVAILLFIAGSLLIGFLIGGRDLTIRNVTGLGTAQRNVTAALVVALQNFGGTDTVTFTLVAAILIPLILLPLSKRLGSRSQSAAPTAVVDAPTSAS